MLTDAIRSLLVEPRAPDPPARVWRDWVLVAVLVPAILLEGILREDVVWRPVVILVALVLVPLTLWRRTHPLLMTAIGFGTVTLLHVQYLVGETGDVGLGTMVFLLLLPYSLYRWGSGREAIVGTAIVLVPASIGLAASETLEDVLGGFAVLSASFALGAAMRYRANAHSREVDRARMLERGELARELHDTVAHHVSAIAIQAQAGTALASTRPMAAVEALRVIEAEASRTLDEMRTMVRVLREGAAAPDFAPQRGIADLELLSRMAGSSPVVDVHRDGELGSLPLSVDVAVYRIAQESVTNAIRHARHASRVDVRVCGDDESVRLTVHDDGDGRGAVGTGYGLLGMAERAKLLGGSCAAGPDPSGGWTVHAVLPREVAR